TEVVGLELERVGHAQVGERPTAVARILLIVVPVLDPDADIAMGLVEDLFRVVLAAVGGAGVFVPLDAGEAADPGDDAAELVGLLPGGVEGSDAARGKAGDSAAVGILAEVVLRRDGRQKLV